MVAEMTFMNDFFELMASSPTPSEVLSYRVSPEEQERITELIEKSKAGQLSLDDRAAIAVFLQVEGAVVLAKSKAFVQLKATTGE